MTAENSEVPAQEEAILAGLEYRLRLVSVWVRLNLRHCVLRLL